MCRDHELCSLAGGVEHQRKKRELALWRERGLGLIQQIKPLAADAVLEDVDEALAMGPRVVSRQERSGRSLVGVDPGAPLLCPCGRRRIQTQLGEFARDPGLVACHPPQIAEEVLRPEVEALPRALAPCKPKRVGEATLGGESVVARRLRGSQRRDLGARGDRFQQRGLARPVLAHQQRHRRAQVERRQGPDRGNRERKFSRQRGRRRFQSHLEEQRHDPGPSHRTRSRTPDSPLQWLRGRGIQSRRPTQLLQSVERRLTRGLVPGDIAESLLSTGRHFLQLVPESDQPSVRSHDGAA